MQDLCAAGVKFLMERHWDGEHGGFTWTLDGHAVKDGQKVGGCRDQVWQASPYHTQIVLAI